MTSQGREVGKQKKAHREEERSFGASLSFGTRSVPARPCETATDNTSLLASPIDANTCICCPLAVVTWARRQENDASRRGGSSTRPWRSREAATDGARPTIRRAHGDSDGLADGGARGAIRNDLPQGKPLGGKSHIKKDGTCSPYWEGTQAKTPIVPIESCLEGYWETCRRNERTMMNEDGMTESELNEILLKEFPELTEEFGEYTS